MRRSRKLFLFPLLLVFFSCQDSIHRDVVGPELDAGAQFSVIPPRVKVALPVTPTWVFGEENFPPAGIAVAPLDALQDFQLLSPFEDATHYFSVRVLPGGNTALAVAVDHVHEPPWTWGAGWSYLVRFDIDSGQLIDKVLLEGVPSLTGDPDGGAAWLFDVSSDGRFAYVSLFYSAALAVVDLRSMEVVGYVHFPPALGPGTGSFLPMVPRLIEGDRALLINDKRRGQVLRVDLESLEFEEVYFSGTRSTLISVSPNGKTLLMTTSPGVRVVDLERGEMIKEIPCELATGVHFPPGRQEVLVTCRDEDRLLAIGPGSWEVSWELEIPGGPQRVSVDPSSRFAVVTTHFGGEVFLLDLERRELLNTVALPNPAWEPFLWVGLQPY